MILNNNNYFSQSLLRWCSWSGIVLHALSISFNASNNMGYAFLLILFVNKDTEAWRNWMKLPKNHTDGKGFQGSQTLSTHTYAWDV